MCRNSTTRTYLNQSLDYGQRQLEQVAPQKCPHTELAEVAHLTHYIRLD